MRNVKVPTQWKINLILVVRKPEIKFKVPASYYPKHLKCGYGFTSSPLDNHRTPCSNILNPNPISKLMKVYLKKYTERMILTAVKETKTQKTKYVKQKNV